MPRYVPVIIQVSDKDGDKVVQKITNAFKQLPADAEQSAKGSSNAFQQHLGAEFFGGLARQGFNAFLQYGKQFIADSLRLAQELQNSLKGLSSVAAFKGINEEEAQAAVRNLRFVRGGIISIEEASTSLKNLLSTGFGLKQSIDLVERFSDASAFGKQAALDYGQAIRGATEGVKNQNSILVDNAGITKNLSVILEERGFKMEDLSNKVKGAAAREALYQGLLKESMAQVGDADKLMLGYTGTIAKQETAYANLQREIGLMIINNPRMIESSKLVAEQIDDVTRATKEQGSETSKTAQQIITAWAVVKSNLLPFISFLTNLFVTFGAAIGVVVTAVLGSALKLIEVVANAVNQALASMVNGLIAAANAASGVLGGPQFQMIQPGAVDLGSAHVFAKMAVAAADMSAAAKGMLAATREGRTARERIFGAGVFNRYDDPGEFAQGQVARVSAADERLARARLLANDQLAEQGKDGSGARRKVKEHLSELEKFDKTSERATLKILYEMGQRSGFIAGTNQSAAAHNVGSFHPLGRALDFSIRGKTPAQVEQFMRELRAEGFTVFDERTRPPGQKKWGGPHIHAQFPAGGIGKDRFGPVDFAVRGMMASMGGRPVIDPGGDATSMSLPMLLNEDEKYREVQKERLDYKNRMEVATLRLRNIEAEATDDYKNGAIELKNLEADLAKIRLEAASSLFTQRRQLVLTQGEEKDLLLQIRYVQDQIATGPYNESLRIQLALQQDILEIRRRDEDAIKAQNRAQLELADAEIFHGEQARAMVLDHLSTSRTQTEVFADAIIDSYEAINSAVLSGVQRLTGGIRIVDNLIAGLITRLTNRLFQKLLDMLIPPSGGGGASGPAAFAGGGGSGGIGGLIRGIFGGFGGGQSSPGAGQFVTGGFAGGSGAGGFLNFGGGGTNAVTAQARALSNIFGLGGGIAAPASLSAQAAQQQSMASILQGGIAGGVAGGAGSAGLLGSFGPAIGAMLPFPGLGLGSSLGGQSRFGSILGGAGGLLAGGIGAAFLAPGLFAAGGALGSLGPMLAGLLTNPFTLAAAPLLLAGAFILNRNAQRRRDETTRNQLSLDVIGQLNALLAQARDMNIGQATAAFEQIRVDYFKQVSQMKDSKTRRIATEWWHGAEHPPQVTWRKIQDAVVAGQRARDIEKRLVPEFAMGGIVPYGNTLFSMTTGLTPIKVRPGEKMYYPDGFSMTVPGVDRGYDSVFTMAPPRTKVLTRSQAASAQGFANGGVVGGGGDIVIQVPDDRVAAILDAQLSGLRSFEGRKLIVRAVREGRHTNQV